MQTPDDTEDQPFLYAIGWTKLDKWYIGCRYAKGCKPSDLWTIYFTSSRYVDAFRKEHGEPDHIEVLFTGSKAFVRVKEEETLRQWTMHRDERFLNATIGGFSFSTDKRGNPKGAKLSAQRRANVTAAMRDPVRRAKAAETQRGRKHTEESKAKIRAAKLGNQNARKGQK
uniref:Nuclease associated modular domain-containing protein n=1 Tax=Caulobacter sp. (strain K31) TaxID=366602 RepID=B0T623_CAUSK